MPSLKFKNAVFDCCLRLKTGEVERIYSSISDLRESSQNDTKSSAGDKHETSRAMVDLEIQKEELRLRNVLNQLEALKKINVEKVCEHVTSGALIETDKAIFFIGAFPSRIEVEGAEVLVMSHSAPIALAMNALKVKSSFTFNGVDYTVQSIF